MNKIYTVKEYNAKAYSRYIVALNQAIKESQDTIPSMSRYIYDRASGYVVSDSNNSKWFGSKSKAQEYLEKIKNEQ